MKKSLKFLSFLTIILYLAGTIAGFIMGEVSIIDLIRYPSLEIIMFWVFNLYIIFVLIIIILKKVKSQHVNKKFFLITSIGYIVLQTLNLALNVYKMLVRYDFGYKESIRLISSSLINPNGLIPNIITVLILLILYLMPEKE
mgnify:FL=1